MKPVRDLDLRPVDTAPAWTWWLLGILALAWLATAGGRHLVPADEGRYAQMAREVFVSGDWMTMR